MAITSGFFNSLSGDRKYNAESFNSFLKGLLSPGIFENVDDAFIVTAGTGMNVIVGGGKLTDSKGRWMISDAATTLSIGASDVTLNRYDAIVAAIDSSSGERTAKIYVKKGTNATNPTKPSITKNDTLEEYCLAYVFVGRGVTAISQSAISDVRADDTVCGFVHGLVTQVPLTELWRQYQAAFDEELTEYQEWFQGIKDTIPDLVRMKDDIGTLDKNAKGTNIKVTGLENDLKELIEHEKVCDKYVYVATGTDDNIKLCNMIETFLEASDQVMIEVVGENFHIGAPSSGSGTVSSRYKYFEMGAEGKKVILDFGRCGNIKGNLKDNSIIFYGQGIHIENLKMTVTGTNTTFSENTDVAFEDCEVSMSGSGTICFAKKGGQFNNCHVDVRSSDSEAFCFEPTEGSFIVATGCRGTARKGTGTGVAAVGYIPTGLTDAALIMNHCHCPEKTVTSTTQTNSIKINSGKFALYGNVVFAKPSIYNASSGVESGTIVM